jgi:hypothetical protein
LREDDDGCNQQVFQPDTWQIGDNQCVAINPNTASFNTTAGALQTANASCEAQPSEMIPPATWGSAVVSCESQGGDECGVGGVCVPDADRPLCIYANGDAESCPDGAYEVLAVFHGDFSDDRDCTACTCAKPTGTCKGDIALIQQGCNGIFLDSIPVPSGCKDIGNAFPTYASYEAEIEASCAAQGGEASGSAEPTEPVTFCCTP